MGQFHVCIVIEKLANPFRLKIYCDPKMLLFIVALIKFVDCDCII